MKNLMKTLFSLAILLSVLNSIQAQVYTQTIRGSVTDEDAQMPLIGATIAVEHNGTVAGTTTDEQGYFKLVDVPVGRINIQVTYLGYEPVIMSSLLLTTGKELVLDVGLTESAVAMEEVVVRAALDKREALNEMATVSARSFSVEETSRYAGSFFDPARMAQNYAGVATGMGDDINNEIIVRGNSPTGVLWRLEGIEIPNPNHYGSLGNSGGGISMLSSTMLRNSDFYTGAFPAEFGNALSGAFDLNLRTGNNEQQEYAFMLGVLGIEAAAEGPFRKNSRSSYLLNYRYSTLSVLEAFNISPTGDETTGYQDLSFKVNIPTDKAGTFSLFGLGGKNEISFDPEPDAQTWLSDDDKWGFSVGQMVGTAGLSHRLLLSDKSYLRTVVAASYNKYEEDEYWLDQDQNYAKQVDEVTTSTNRAYRASSTYHHKFDARNSLRTGAIFSHLTFDFSYDEDEGEGLARYFDNAGETNFVQAFANWKHRLNEDWTLHTGLHYSMMLLNNNYVVEPRAALQWQVDPRHRLSLAAGIHSRMEHLAVYLFDGEVPGGNIRKPFPDLELIKALHLVLGHDFQLSEQLRLKTELYFQHLYDVPIEADPVENGSILNAVDIWDVIGAQDVVNQGLGRNYGLDMTLERFFHRGHYFLLTGSIYDSKYQPADGRWYNTAFNGQYQLTALGGKEWKVGRNKKNIIGWNGKFVLSGGRRYTPINLEASKLANEAVRYEDQPFAARAGAYSRFDVGFSYRINARKVTHSILLDIQNVTNRQNVYSNYYDEDTQNIEAYYQTGLLPIFNYRIEF